MYRLKNLKVLNEVKVLKAPRYKLADFNLTPLMKVKGALLPNVPVNYIAPQVPYSGLLSLGLDGVGIEHKLLCSTKHFYIAVSVSQVGRYVCGLYSSDTNNTALPYFYQDSGVSDANFANLIWDKVFFLSTLNGQFYGQISYSSDYSNLWASASPYGNHSSLSEAIGASTNAHNFRNHVYQVFEEGQYKTLHEKLQDLEVAYYGSMASANSVTLSKRAIVLFGVKDLQKVPDLKFYKDFGYTKENLAMYENVKTLSILADFNYIFTDLEAFTEEPQKIYIEAPCDSLLVLEK